LTNKEKLTFKKQKKQLKKPKLVDPIEEPKSYTIQLTPTQVFLRTVGFLVILIWVFALGVLAGRGLPLVDPKDESIQAHFIRFLGLGKEPPPPVENAADAWLNKERIVTALQYHEALTQQPRPAVPLTPKKDSSSKSGTKSSKDGTDSKSKETDKKSTEKKAPSDDASGPYTIMVASMRNIKYAEALVEKLRTKGHAARLQSVKGSEGKPWHRVMVGAFESRGEAQKYTAEINRSESLKAMVVRGGG
jgi:cell division septation protein DedD